MPDVVYSTFRDEGVRVLSCDLSMRDGKSEAKAFTELGKKLGFKKQQTFQAYLLAKQAEHQLSAENVRKLENALAKPDLKVLICGHAYNIYDRYIGRPRGGCHPRQSCHRHSRRLDGPGQGLAGGRRHHRHHALDGQPGAGGHCGAAP